MFMSKHTYINIFLYTYVYENTYIERYTRAYCSVRHTVPYRAKLGTSIWYKIKNLGQDIVVKLLFNVLDCCGCNNSDSYSLSMFR